jgi:hypothetical protein
VQRAFDKADVVEPTLAVVLLLLDEGLLAKLRRLKSSVCDYDCETSSIDLFGSFSLSYEEKIKDRVIL